MENLQFDPMAFVNNLGYMGIGMLGVFMIIFIIVIATYAIGAIGAPKDENNGEGQG